MKDRILFHDRLEWLPADVSTSNPRLLSGLWLAPGYTEGRDLLCVRVGLHRIPCFCNLKGHLPDGRAILLFSVRLRTRRGWKWLRLCRETPEGASRTITRRLLRMARHATADTTGEDPVPHPPPADEAAFLAAQPLPPEGPLVSVLMPVFNPPADCLERAVASVRAQTYTRWELCIADDASTDPSVPPLLARIAASDPRIKVSRRPVNGHISAATNSALALASGEWSALLDQDDELSPHTLAVFVRAVARQPDAELAYSDEDKFDENGRRHGPYRKPEWMPELLLGQNFVSHLGIYRTKRLRAIGGFREGFEGCQDWDMALRFTRGLAPGRILHLPYTLYHWRALPHSTASAIEAKPYVVAAAERTVSAALADRGIAARLSTLTPAQFRVEPLAPRLPPVALIGRASRADQHRLTASTDYEPLSFLTHSNSASNPLAQLLQAARNCTAEILVFLPPTCSPRRKDWLRRLAGALLIADVAAAGGPVIGPHGDIADGCLTLDEKQRVVAAFKGMAETDQGYFGRAQLLHNPDGLGLHGIAVRRDALLAIGELKTSRWTGSMTAGWELCARLRATGRRLVYDPGVLIDHDESNLRFNETSDLRHLLFATRPTL